MKPDKLGILIRKPPKISSWQGVLWLSVGLMLLLPGCNYPVAPASTFTPDPPNQTAGPATITAPTNPRPTGTPFYPQPTVTQTPTASPTPIPSPTATSPYPEPPTTPRTRYRMEVDFDYGRQFLVVEQTAWFPNLTGEPLADLVMIVDANAHLGIFNLESLTLPADTPFNGYTLEGTQLRIQLDAPLPPGHDLELALTFTLDLPLQASTLGYTNRETLLLDWYPFFPPYQTGKGWLANPPWPYGEYLAYDLADYDVSITVTNAPDELVLAAGAPAVEIDGRFEYSLPAARSFAWSASPFYQVTQLEQNGVTIVSHTYREHTAAGLAALQTAGEALALYGEQFSAYPRSYFALVEAEFADGREYDGVIFVSRNYHAEYSGTPRDFLILLIAHEVAHQWWYGLVGNDQAGEPWLDEAFSTYSELLYYERYHPDLVSWWWQFRVNYFRPEGWVNWSLYDTGRFTVYFHAVYLRGALFLRDLRALMGDEAFFALLRNYNQGLAYRLATSEDFFQYLNEFPAEEIGPLVAAYFTERNAGE